MELRGAAARSWARARGGAWGAFECGLAAALAWVFAGEVLSMNLLGMTAIAADGRKAVRNLVIVLNPSEQRGAKC